jgi:polysaccharide biosynthesis/export protein
MLFARQLASTAMAVGGPNCEGSGQRMACRSWLTHVLAAMLVCTTFGCAPNSGNSASSGSALGRGRAYSSEERTATVTPTNGRVDLFQLEELWTERHRDGFSTDFAIGPGDTLAVSVADMEELRGREGTVSADGTLILPVIGVVKVGGLNDRQVKIELEHDLARYMRDPNVDVHVKRYNSREVAVIGLVQKPGLYTLASHSDTILEMITKAGGMTENASPRIIFVPSPAAARALQADRFAAADELSPISQRDSAATQKAVPGEVVEQPATSESFPRSVSVEETKTFSSSTTQVSEINLSLMHEHPIEIDLTDESRNRLFINLPARPGDVIIVPATGEVMVEGWVKNPGAFKITPGMTALGAITAAGGEQFSSSAEVLRKGLDEVKAQLTVDLRKVKHGEAPDVAVQSGDVVIVKPSTIGAVPYFAYSLFSKFATGAYVPIPF